MGRSHTAVSVVTIFAILGMADGVLAGPAKAEPNLRATVRIDDQAGVPAVLLKFAEARADQVFAMSGVNIDWVDREEADRLQSVAPYTILIMAEAPASLKVAMAHMGMDLMGQAAPSIGRAYVYYDRVLKVGSIPPRDVVAMLGDVIAHELGHLMLPPGHSNLGIMRHAIDMTTRRLETFTKLEANEIRERVRGPIATETR
jgi:hypothetical protein